MKKEKWLDVLAILTLCLLFGSCIGAPLLANLRAYLAEPDLKKWQSPASGEQVIGSYSFDVRIGKYKDRILEVQLQILLTQDAPNHYRIGAHGHIPASITVEWYSSSLQPGARAYSVEVLKAIEAWAEAQKLEVVDSDPIGFLHREPVTFLIRTKPIANAKAAD